MEDEVGRRVAGRPLRGVRVAAVRVKGRDGRVVADLERKQSRKFHESSLGGAVTCSEHAVRFGEFMLFCSSDTKFSNKHCKV